MKKFLALVFVSLLLIGAVSVSGFAQGAVGTVELPLGTQDFWIAYPYYKPYDGAYYASSGYTEDMCLGDLLFTAGSRQLFAPQDVPFYREASFDSGLIYWLPSGTLLQANGEYNGLYYDGNTETWMLVYVVGRDRYGWVPVSYMYPDNQTPSSPSENMLYGYSIQRISTRMGPGSSYPAGGTYNKLKNTWLQVRARAWDKVNEIWWVEVLVGDRWEWTGYSRFDSTTLPLESIPMSAEYSSTGTTSDGSDDYTTDGAVYGYSIQRISTRTGPGTNYPSGGTYNKLKNTWLQVRARAWDKINEIWWVEVLVGDEWLWTGYSRFDSTTLSLESLPIKNY